MRDYSRRYGRFVVKSAIFVVSRARLPLAQPLLRVASQGVDQRLELFGCLSQSCSVDAAQHESHAEIAPPKVRVGADLEIGITRLQRSEIFRQRTLGELAADAAAEHPLAADEAVLQLLEDPLHDAGHAGQDEDIADLE